MFSIIENEFEQKLIFVLLIFTNIMLMILYLKKTATNIDKLQG